MSIWNTPFLAGRIIGPLALLAGGFAMVRPDSLPAYLEADTALALGKALVITALVVIAAAGWTALPHATRSKLLPFGRGPAQRVIIRIRKRR